MTGKNSLEEFAQKNRKFRYRQRSTIRRSNKGGFPMKHSTARYLILFLSFAFGVFLLAPVTGSQGEEGFYPALPGRFFLADANGNQVPDHLGFTVLVKGNYAEKKFWLCGELQALVGDNWQTLAYTAQEFDWAGAPVEASIYFYGGEIRRLQQDGPFRLLLQLKGVDVDRQEFAGFTPSYQHEAFEKSDLVLTGGEAKKTSEVLKMVEDWAKSSRVTLGPLEEATFTFDRWRLDFQGTRREPARRVWVEPTGEISCATRVRARG